MEIVLLSISELSSYISSSDAPEESEKRSSRKNKRISETRNQNLVKTSHSTSLETLFPLSKVLDDINMFIQVVRKSKKDFCIYCQTEEIKLSRYLIRNHKDNKEYYIICIPKGRLERRSMINKIRKNG